MCFGKVFVKFVLIFGFFNSDQRRNCLIAGIKLKIARCFNTRIFLVQLKLQKPDNDTNLTKTLPKTR